jgi:hypothetical protein
MCSFDIENMYTNIPRNSLINIVKNILQHNYEIEEKTKVIIIHILKSILDQNYSQFDLGYYKQNDGLAMGAPTSAILAETYIQNIEHAQIYHILKTENNSIFQIR